MARVRFLMLGGFLGAGKTTAIARLARHYTDKGLRVGLVTNDQAYDLVDTQSLRAQGFDVGEVPGACFCCKFDDLVQTATELGAAAQPDILITEPVGSCTDLAATVVEPLRHLYGDSYEIGPLAVLLKPEHGRKILRGEENVGFSPKAAYIFLKQIEEADIVVVNKVDKLSEEARDELLDLVRTRFPEKRVLAASAREGAGFDELIAALEEPRKPQAAYMEVDYDTYAEGEAELGWLNCQAEFRHAEELSLDPLVQSLVGRLAAGFTAHGWEAAHLKVLGQIGTASAIANLVDSESEPELSLESGARAATIELTVNARVAAAPEDLERVVREAIAEEAAAQDAAVDIRGMQRFRPGRPVPTHRFGAE